MEPKEMSVEEITRRLNILRGYGFITDWGLSKVMVYGTCVDFSAINEKYYLEYAFGQVRMHGEAKGRKQLQRELKELIMPDDEDEI